MSTISALFLIPLLSDALAQEPQVTCLKGQPTGTWRRIADLPEPGLDLASIDGDGRLCLSRSDGGAEASWCLPLCDEGAHWQRAASGPDATTGRAALDAGDVDLTPRIQSLQWQQHSQRELAIRPLRGTLEARAPGLELRATWTRADLASRATVTHFAEATLLIEGKAHTLPEDGAPSPRVHYTLRQIPAGVLVLGGLDAAGQPLLDGAIYDPGTGSWRRVSPAPNQSITFGAWRALFTTPEGWMVFGGHELRGARYDLASESWTQLDTSGVPPGFQPSKTSWNGRHLLAGNQVFTPMTGLWRPLNPALPSSAEADPIRSWAVGEDLLLVAHYNKASVGSRPQASTLRWLGLVDLDAASTHAVSHDLRYSDGPLVSRPHASGSHDILVTAQLAVLWGGETPYIAEPGGGCEGHTGPEACDPYGPVWGLEAANEAWVLLLPD